MLALFVVDISNRSYAPANMIDNGSETEAPDQREEEEAVGWLLFISRAYRGKGRGFVDCESGLRQCYCTASRFPSPSDRLYGTSR